MFDNIYRELILEILEILEIFNKLINLSLKIGETGKHPADQEVVNENVYFAKTIKNATYVILDNPEIPIKLLKKDTPMIVYPKYKLINNIVYLKIKYANDKFGFVNMDDMEFETRSAGNE